MHVFCAARHRSIQGRTPAGRETPRAVPPGDLAPADPEPHDDPGPQATRGRRILHRIVTGAVRRVV